MAKDKAEMSEKTKPRRVKRLLVYVLVVLAVLVVFTVSVVGGLEYYTGRNEFCDNCHIMDPYYKSWQKDVHSTKNVAGCVDCHYAPGERHTFEAKLRGLSQVTSYFSGRSGGQRPRPKVQDPSCLQTGCHRVEDIAEKVYPIRDVKFVHAKHIKLDEEKIRENAKNLSDLAVRLSAVVDEPTFDRLRQLAVTVGSPEINEQKLDLLIRSVSSDPAVVDAAREYVQAVHREIRLNQLGNLRCTTCHAHNDDEKHFSVRRQICYTCHFLNQKFNTDTGQCLNCHEPPTVEVPVHGKGFKMEVGQATQAAGTMDHAVIIANKVNCVSCHADLVAGTGNVARQRCGACHDQARYYDDFDHNLNTKTVASLHTVHTSHLYASCTDCHEEIQHRLRTKEQMMLVGGFLQPVLGDCAHCHPNHHHSQVELMMGKAPNPVPPGNANSMFGSRVNCLGCHTRSVKDTKGTDVVEATKQACVICHSDDYNELFDQWINRLQASIKDANSLEAQAAKLLDGLDKDTSETRRAAADALAKGRAALEFVKSAQGIHNRNYSLELLDYATTQFNQVIAQIGSQITASSSEK